jgi:hypothetical protein
MATHTNRLAAEPSLYLQQHGHNPVDWYPWGDEALARARALDRPIFLSIGYASCHWCHVMERESFEDAEVARILNAHFVAIKVDREERPDLDAAYMQAVQTLSGGGGWPLSAFLTPDGQPFFGGTYFARDAFVDLLDGIVRVFELQRTQVERSAAELAALVRHAVPPEPAPAVDARALERAARELLVATDPDFGGVGGPQKFATPARWEFALGRLRQRADPPLHKAVRTTLEQMAAGGLRDHVGGGFYRYCVERTWTVPHFEKMLYDNAQLASLYALASRVLDAPRAAEIAVDTLDFLLDTLRDAGGGFCASLDADAAGHEGATYLWTPDELAELAGDDGPALCALLGVSAAGHLEGRSVPTRRLADEPPGLFERLRPRLREVRARRPQPARDRKVVTSWNGLAIAALCRGHAVTGVARYLQGARAAADFLWRRHRGDDGALRRASTDDRVAGRAVLDDLAFVAAGLLELFAAGQRLDDLQRSVELVEAARRDFAHPEGGFYLTARDDEAPLGHRAEWMDGVEPSGNAVMAGVLLRLAALTGRVDLRQDAERALRRHAALLHTHPLMGMAWLEAAALALEGIPQLAIAGEPAADDTLRLLAGVRAWLIPGVTVVHVAAQGASAAQLALMPWLEGKHAIDGRATAYVCEHGRCRTPSRELDEIRAQLARPA